METTLSPLTAITVAWLHYLPLDFIPKPQALLLLPLDSPACTEVGMNSEQSANLLQWPSIVILKLGRKKDND